MQQLFPLFSNAGLTAQLVAVAKVAGTLYSNAAHTAWQILVLLLVRGPGSARWRAARPAQSSRPLVRRLWGCSRCLGGGQHETETPWPAKPGCVLWAPYMKPWQTPGPDQDLTLLMGSP